MHSSPFKFLDSYTREDRAIFFGREKEIEELYRKVFESKILLVYGISGTGKSSLIHCGLANKFQESDWLPINVRRGGDFLESMALALKQVALTPITHELKTPQQFRKAVRSVYLDHYKPVFFLFDQFEELFIFGSAQEKELFLQVFKNLLASDIQCRFLFILREEYLASLSPFEKAIPGFFANRLRIERMSHENASQAIEGPCKVHGIEVEEGFAKKVLEKLCPDENEVELTFLQVYLDRLFRLASQEQHASGSLQFQAGLIETAGSVTDILGNFVDEQIAQQADPEVALAVLKAFVSTRGTRQPMAPGEVSDYALSLGRQVEEKDLATLLATFVNLRILQDKDQHGKYELRHDALAAKIYEKFTLVEKELLEVRRFVENALQNYQTRGILLGKDDLSYLDGYSSRIILPTELNEFVKNCRQRITYRERAFRRLSWVSAVLFILIAAGIIRYYQRTQTSAALDDQINLAVFQSEFNPMQSLSTVAKIWERDSSSAILRFVFFKDIRRILDSPADSSPVLQRFCSLYSPVHLGSAILKAEMSKNGKYIYGLLKDGSVFILDPNSKKLFGFQAGNEILTLEISERDSLLAIIYRNGNCEISDFYGEQRFAVKVSPNKLMNERLVCFFPEGKYCLAFVSRDTACIVDYEGKQLFALKGHHARINSVDISKDGRFIATASCDKQVLLWNYNYQTKLFSPYDTLLGHRDTVWSCEFNRSGLYVLTASADSTTRVWDLEGNDLNPDLNFGFVVSDASHHKFNDLSTDEDRVNPVYASYYKKACNASFSKNEQTIIMTGYDFGRHNQAIFSQVLFFDNSYGKTFQYITEDMLWGLRNLEDSLSPVAYSRVVLSPDARIVVVAIAGSEQLQVVAVNGFILTSLQGFQPMFSSDGLKLFWVQKDRINILPLNILEVQHTLSTDSVKNTFSRKNNWTIL